MAKAEATEVQGNGEQAPKEVKKFPQLEEIRGQLEKEREGITKKSAPLHKERDALLSKIQPLEAQLADVDKRIKETERPRLGEINRQLAALARTMGGRSMSQSQQ